jgi:uncharacterized MAPEG superfamily protein
MRAELVYLAWTAMLTALLWLPYVSYRMWVWGVGDTLGYPHPPKAMAPWAERAKKAHYNAVENLVVFAALLLAGHALGRLDQTTETAAAAYFWSRMGHYGVYVLGIPYLRTVFFLASWAACLVIFLRIVGG